MGMKEERQNIRTYFKIFIIFMIAFVAALLLLGLFSSFVKQDAEIESKVQEKVYLDMTQKSHIPEERVVHIPGYTGDFIILTDSFITIGYFTDTRVMYSLSSGYGILTLLVTSDGSPMLYEGGN